MGALVAVQNGEARTTSLALADGTGSEHASVIKLVRTYRGDLEEFGLLGFNIAPRLKGQHGGGNTEYATLNEPQATLIMTYMKNIPIVREFKKRLVRAFYELSSGSNIMMQHIRLLEQRLNRIESTTQPKAKPHRGYAVARKLSPITRMIHDRGTTITQWSFERGLSRVMVSQQINGLVLRKHIEDALVADGLIKRASTPLQIPYTKGGESMKQPKTIDVKATNAMFDTKCISRSAWARSKNINPAVFYQRLSGHLGIPDTIRDLLRADGLLVEN